MDIQASVSSDNLQKLPTFLSSESVSRKRRDGGQKAARHREIPQGVGKWLEWEKLCLFFLRLQRIKAAAPSGDTGPAKVHCEELMEDELYKRAGMQSILWVRPQSNDWAFLWTVCLLPDSLYVSFIIKTKVFFGIWSTCGLNSHTIYSMKDRNQTVRTLNTQLWNCAQYNVYTVQEVEEDDEDEEEVRNQILLLF